MLCFRTLLNIPGTLQTTGTPSPIAQGTMLMPILPRDQISLLTIPRYAIMLCHSKAYPKTLKCRRLSLTPLFRTTEMTVILSLSIALHSSLTISFS